MFSTSNKDRFYVCLYLRSGSSKMPGKEDTYHWAFVAGPKLEDPDTKGTRYHAKEDMQRPPPFLWEYVKEETGTLRAHALLVRVLVGKINSLAVLDSILGTIPIRAGDQDYPGWNCIAWIKEALETISRHPDRQKALGTAVLDWQLVRDAALSFARKKRAQGRWGADAYKTFDLNKAPTFDLLCGKETIA